MRYKTEIEYLRLVPWYRRWQLIVIRLDWWKHWWKWLNPLADFLMGYGFKRWLLLTYDEFEYATAYIDIDVEYTGTWHPPEPDAGYQYAYFVLHDFTSQPITLPGDYCQEFQEEEIHVLMRREHDNIREACIQYEYDNT